MVCAVALNLLSHFPCSRSEPKINVFPGGKPSGISRAGRPHVSTTCSVNFYDIMWRRSSFRPHSLTPSAASQITMTSLIDSNLMGCVWELPMPIDEKLSSLSVDVTVCWMSTVLACVIVRGEESSARFWLFILGLTELSTTQGTAVSTVKFRVRWTWR